MDLKLLIGAILVTVCFSAEIPSSVKRCDRKDSNFDQCLATAIEDALSKSTSPIKSIGLPVVDPIEISALDIAAGTGPVAFGQKFQNIKFLGFSKSKCSQAHMDFDSKTLTLDCTSPQVILQFKYEINGKLLLLPVFGKGPGTIELDDLNFKLKFHFDEYDKNGKKHYKIKDKELTLTPKLITFKLENLFNGDKTLADNILKVMNENWSDVFGDVKTSYESAIVQVFASVFDHVLAKVSVEELFDEA